MPKWRDVLGLVRGNWGNHAAAVSRDEVGRVRKNHRYPKDSAVISIFGGRYPPSFIHGRVVPHSEAAPTVAI